jgi:hypothetical protein
MPDFWNANFYYPVQGALAFSDHLLGPALQLLLLLDLRLVPNSVAGYNVLLVSSFVLSGATTSWVLHRGGRSWPAAVLGGFLFAFAPMRWAHLEHLQVLLAQWVPPTLWTWDRLLADATWKRAAAFLSFYLLSLAGGCYLAYMIHLPLIAIGMSRASGWRKLADPRRWAALLAVAVAAGGSALWLYTPYLAVSHRYGLERSAGEVALYSATLASYAAPSESNVYAGVWHRLADRWQIDPSQDEGRLFGGFLATVFAVCGGVVFLRRPGGGQEGRPLTVGQRLMLGALLAAAAAAFVWCDLRTLQEETPDDGWNGPALLFGLAVVGWTVARRRWRRTGWKGGWLRRWADIDPWERGVVLGGALCFLMSFPLAFVPLMRVVPGLASLRAPGRFGVFTSLAAAFLGLAPV